jgi:ABC-type nickel/cobalt efflux system permease component RcnA
MIRRHLSLSAVSFALFVLFGSQLLTQAVQPSPQLQQQQQHREAQQSSQQQSHLQQTHQQQAHQQVNEFEQVNQVNLLTGNYNTESYGVLEIILLLSSTHYRL